MAPVALALFVSIATFGAQYFGWEDPGGKIQLCLIATFVFGVICGYRVKS